MIRESAGRPGGPRIAFKTVGCRLNQAETGLMAEGFRRRGYAVAEHGSERMSQGLLVEMGGAALSEAVSSQPAQTQQLWMTAFAVGAQYGALLPFSRLHESEADRLGLIFMALAGYDPHAAVDFWQRMRKSSGGGAPPEFPSTHPSHETRISDLQGYMPEAVRYYQP